MIGRIVSHYQILEELGKGGMGVVYLAEDIKLKRRVALKFLPAHLTSDSRAIERFEREAQATAALNHPNIVTIYDVGEFEGQTFICVEYVEGRDFSRVIENGPVPIEQVLETGMQVCAALKQAHDIGIVHRDIKPANILIDRNESVKLADFGLAKLRGVSKLTRDASALGTMEFMSPEQLKGDIADHRADIWALGIVLYTALSGRPAWTGDYEQAIAYSIVNEPHAPIRQLRPGVPEKLEKIIDKALAKNPDDRYQTVVEMSADLGSVGVSLGLDVGRLSAGTDRHADSVKRRYHAVTVAVVFIMIVAAAAFLRNRRDGSVVDSGTPPAATKSAQMTFKQITFYAGTEEYPALSPDGSQIAYCAEVERFKQIFIKDVYATSARQLTDVGVDHIHPAWSPDGKSLLFVRSHAQGGKLEPSDVFGYHSNGDIWLLDIESGAEQQIIRNAFNPAFSPDGTHIAFDASLAGPRRIWTADRMGRNPRQITFDDSEAIAQIAPSWSPDGSKIAFQNIEWTTFDIAVVDVATGEIRSVTSDGYLDLNPVWSRGGKAIIFSSYRSGGLNVWRVTVDTRGLPVSLPEQISMGSGQDIQLSMSRDGRHLAFSIAKQNADIWRLPVSPDTGLPTGDPEPIITTTREDSRGAWSPDGKQIAFNSDRTGDMNLWLYTMDDGSVRQLTTGKGGDYQAAWSPDGKRLAFFSARAGNNDVWMVDIDSGDLERITTKQSMDINPFFTPGGDQIVYQSDLDGRRELWVVNADGSERRRLTNIGVSCHFTRWSADGERVVFHARSEQPGALFEAFLNGEPSVPYAVIRGGHHLSYSPDHSLIMDVSGHKVLWVSAAAGDREPVKVFEFDNPDSRIDYPVWSPDGTSVLFDHFEPQGGDIWLMSNLE